MKKSIVLTCLMALGLFNNAANSTLKNSLYDKSVRQSQGVWYQEGTDSFWDRCWLGETWNDKTQECEGKRLKLTWHDAQKYIDEYVNADSRAGYNDWRLPTAYELSLRRTCIMIMPFGQEKDFGWLEESEGSVLTKEGRKPVMKVVTKSIPNNDGNFIDVPARCAREYAQDPDFDFWALNQTKGGVWYLAGTNYQGREMKQTDSADKKFYAWIVRSDKKPVLSAEQNQRLLTDEEKMKQRISMQFDLNPTKKEILK
ncbi:DUF1566 domain-containing protein [Moraxella sp.]|uniref:DUF1566 domain-containing protein n=1 Tax=Moraxella sp. TaxID=479 RepID=UPI0026DD36E6|nr:DUF1566 domain-containing protein [Moraxella sp.]MDO4895110.1 DUF1566 domain-containing protein [Moraxella sp.]